MGFAQSLRNMIMGQETIVLPKADIVRRPVSFETVAPSPLMTVTSNGIEVSINLDELLGASPVKLFRTQPYLRAVVSFLSRNIAQLGLHTYERISDTERERSTDSVTAKLIRSPNDYTTRYELIDALVADLALWDQAFWAVTPDSKREPGWRITPIPVAWVDIPAGGNFWQPDKWRVTKPGSPTVEIGAENMIHFHGWDPEHLQRGVSPVETLKNILAEQIASVVYRQQRWERGGRVGAVITRPAGAPQWSEGAEDRFRREWRNAYASRDGSDAGGTPILQDGMTLTKIGFSAVEDEFVEANKLALTTVASVYHVNPTMLGLLDNANYSNVREFRRMLYGDTLGPWLSMIEDRLNSFLVPKVEDDPQTDLYVEFNISEKLQGSFEEQATVANMAVGGPYMTRNEYRARQNMPPIDGADDLIIPLNVATEGAPPPAPAEAPKGQIRLSDDARRTKVARWVQVRARASRRAHNRTEAVLRSFYRRQSRVVLSQLGSKADTAWWDSERWNAELRDDLYRLALQVNDEVGTEVFTDIGLPDPFDAEANADLLLEVVTSRAEWINETTKAAIVDALSRAGEEDAPTPADVFKDAEQNRAGLNAVTLCTTFAAIASKEAGRQAAPEGGATKTWVVQSKNSRHPEMNGQTVGIEEKFSNGADWPGDAVLGPDETSGCHCELVINIP